MAEFLERQRGMPVSNVIGIAFGGLWAYAGCLNLAPGWRTGAAVAAALVGALFLLRLLRSPASASGGRSLFRATPYWVALVLEVVCIFLASTLLPRYGYAAYLLQVVGVIVGLHFLGLWEATGSRRMLGIVLGMCAVSAVGMLLPHSAASDVRPADVWTGLGNALVLWVGASQRP